MGFDSEELQHAEHIILIVVLDISERILNDWTNCLGLIFLKDICQTDTFFGIAPIFRDLILRTMSRGQWPVFDLI